MAREAEVAQRARVGVVVPTLNSAATLDWTLLSLRSQRGCQVEIVVADSGSQDGTLQICTRWDVPVTYCPPGNLYRAVMVGFEQLQSPWLTYIGSDDLYYADALARLVEMGERTGADVVYGHCDLIDAYGRFLYSHTAAAPADLSALFRLNVMPFVQPSAIIRRGALDDLRGFDTSFRHVADFDLFARASRAGKRFVRLPAPAVVMVRLHDQQIHAREWDVVLKEKASLLAAAEKGRLDQLAQVRWRLANGPGYAVRLLRRLSLGR